MNSITISKEELTKLLETVKHIESKITTLECHIRIIEAENKQLKQELINKTEDNHV